ncbi:transketolase [Treponema parvum]|uniref:Transketolase n=1 Tax=Treponema parvum TaxID=138851 RepID=A0A975ID60_9SPIR|nr:transketolase [Treponema parvum]QTQ12492.1 transketolase [Treponema parvum]QTQ15514.1 transketolase [Treponema parvum]
MNQKGIAAAALSIRSLSMDAIQKANSGHPGIAMGAAELAAVLYGEIMKHNPENSKWPDRDRFVLSAGHGSMLLYSILHLAGYKVSLQNIKNFRQIGSKCAGHPEYGLTDGVECTTGPLGQGISMAVGMAIAETMLAARFNTSKHTVVDHYTYSLVGEGCLMEGVSSEASSLAGHLKLGKLIVFYDENRISIDGSTDITFTDDIAKRYEAYGWQVLKGSMYDVDGIVSLTEQAKKCKDKPTLIMLKSVIGKGAPKENTADVHGSPLGVQGVLEAKKKLGLPEDKQFYVVPEAYEYFKSKKESFAKAEKDWNAEFEAWSKENPELRKTWDAFFKGKATGKASSPVYKTGDKAATRDVNGKVLNAMASRYMNLVGGSADLTGSNKTKLENSDGIYTFSNRKGRYIEFGIREFAMSAVCCGITLHGGLRAFGATFLVFVDYMRASLRLAALQKINPIYILTHDSIYVGEDGPTHQPIETFAGLRAIPNVQFLRPGDPQEAELAWEMAMESKDHPVCMAFTRQALKVYEKADPDWKTTARKGAYVVHEGSAKPGITILATGSEVNMALEAAKLVPNKKIRVVSVTDLNLFGRQDKEFQDKIIGPAKRVVTAEAGISMGWDRFATSHEDIFCIDRFGESGPAEKVAEHLGFTAEKLAELLKK